MGDTAKQHRELAGLESMEILKGLALIHPLLVASDPGGRIVWMSGALTSICGGADAYIGAGWNDLFPRTPKPERLGPLDATRPRDGVADHRLKLDCANGSTVEVDVTSFRIGSASHALIVSIVRPALDAPGPSGSSARPASSLLGKTGPTLAMLDDSPQAVIAVDRSGFVAYANAAVESITGKALGEVIDKPVAALLPMRASLGPIATTIRTGRRFTSEGIEVKRSDGSRILVSMSVLPWRLPDGEVLGTVAYLQDITGRSRIQETLQAKNDELENYVHSVSHDLRSPLVSVLGFSRLLRQDFAHLLGDSGNHFLDRIEQGGRTMESLIQDLLELSQIGRTGEPRILVDPRSVLVQIAAELKPRLDEQHVSLIVPQDPPMVFSDRTRLYQIFSNLIGNALNHMGPCESPEIRVAIEDEAGQHHITVSDNGRGIDPRDHKRIFEVFQSLGRHSDGRRSTGIGLAIVKKIAEIQGGRVWVDSEPGRGSVFHLVLPRT